MTTYWNSQRAPFTHNASCIFPSWRASWPAVTLPWESYKKCKITGATLLSDANTATSFVHAIQFSLFRASSSLTPLEIVYFCVYAFSVTPTCYAFRLNKIIKWLLTNLTLCNFFVQADASYIQLWQRPPKGKGVSTAEMTSWQRTVNERETKTVYKTIFLL